MPSLRGLVGRIRGEAPIRQEIAELRALAEATRHEVAEIREVLLGLNHDVRAGSAETLPLFLGYAERFRVDAETMVGATELIDRQLALIEGHVERLAPPAPPAET